MQQRGHLSAEAIAANRRGVELRSQGRVSEAADAFRAGIDVQPELHELHVNLASTLVELGRLDDAREAYRRALEIDDANEYAHLALYEIEQVRGDRDAAMHHQAAVLMHRSLFSVYARNERRRILALQSPGDWQANVPLDYLADPETTTLHKLYLTSERQAASVPLPGADALFTAIAYSSENEARLEWAQAIAERSGLPVINDPRSVRNTERSCVFELLRGMPYAYVPPTYVVAREALERGHGEFPMVIRPLDSQAGAGLARIENAAELQPYLDTEAAHAYYVMPYVDYVSPDGYFRKYRIFVVGGVPLPCHMALSTRWMIHYYNAPMREHQWMRDEERTVLENFDEHFPQALRDSLTDVAKRLALDYTGVDCAIDRDGRLLIFEADPAMIVHAADEPELFAYKHAAAHRIFAAFAELVDRARSR